MAQLEIDYMEYSTNALAQAAYVTNANDANVLTGGTATADTVLDASYVAANAVDGSLETSWLTTITALPHYWQYQLGSAKIVTKLNIYLYRTGAGTALIKDFTLQGSANGSSWTTIYTGVASDILGWEEYTFSNTTAYLYYKINITSNYRADGLSGIIETTMIENPLQSYSEATIKTQGTYSLRGAATITNSLNKTLTRTVV